MRRTTMIGTVLMLGLAAPIVNRAQAPLTRAGLSCLHDESSGPSNRPRREQAKAVIRAINAAEGRAARATRQYLPLRQLAGLPAVPAGFELRLYTDGEGYIASLKDSRDPCHYGVFSDEQGRLYEMTPQPPLLAS
jgi:hypothetical protein